MSSRAQRIRGKLRQHLSRPRLSVFRSNKYIYAQVIDDAQGKTLAAARGEDPKTVGEQIAKSSLAAKVKTVAFDRGGYNYHGRVKLLAESARAAGLEF